MSVIAFVNQSSVLWPVTRNRCSVHNLVIMKQNVWAADFFIACTPLTAVSAFTMHVWLSGLTADSCDAI